MSNPVEADFTGVKHVKGRSVYVLNFEVPEEMIDAVLERLKGMPRAGKSRWCAIVALETPDA